MDFSREGILPRKIFQRIRESVHEFHHSLKLRGVEAALPCLPVDKGILIEHHAVDGDSALAALAVRFNRSQERYRIDVQDYGSLTDLYNAILTGEAMDLIDLSGVDVESLMRQGVLTTSSVLVLRSNAIHLSSFVQSSTVT